MFGLTPFRKRSGELLRNKDVFDLNTYFKEFFNEPFLPSIFNSDIRVDVRETEKEYIVEADLPGIKKEEIKLEIDNDRVTISVERKHEDTIEKTNYIHKERRYGAMSRSFYVDNIDNDNVTAKFENGVLEINLPKKNPGKPKNRQIEIQ